MLFCSDNIIKKMATLKQHKENQHEPKARATSGGDSAPPLQWLSQQRDNKIWNIYLQIMPDIFSQVYEGSSELKSFQFWSNAPPEAWNMSMATSLGAVGLLHGWMLY